jgi:hypothetical protein
MKKFSFVLGPNEGTTRLCLAEFLWTSDSCVPLISPHFDLECQSGCATPVLALHVGRERVGNFLLHWQSGCT